MLTPNKCIVKELKNIDPDLSVEWDNRIKRFMVYHKDRRHRTYPVMRIQYQNGAFKPLDDRTVKALRYSNYLRSKRPQDILYLIDKQNNYVEQQKDKQFTNDGKAIASELPRGFMNLGGINDSGTSSNKS